MVEAAIGALLIIALILGVIQSAMLARAHIAAEDASTAGARAGAIAANSPAADYALLQAVARAGSALSKNQLSKIIVYKATGPDTDVPPACLSGPQDGTVAPCNVYSPVDLARPGSDFGSPPWNGDMHWPASQRVASVSAGPDYIGVYVEARCGCMGSFSLPQLTSNKAVVRIEANVP